MKVKTTITTKTKADETEAHIETRQAISGTTNVG